MKRIDARVDPAFRAELLDGSDREEWVHSATGIFKNGSASAAHMRYQMENAGLDQAVLHASIVPGEGPIASNDAVAALVRAEPDRYFGVAAVDPTDPGAADEVERAMGDLGLRGVVVHLSRAHMHANDDRLPPVLDACEAAGVPLVIPSGTSWDPGAIASFSRPMELERWIATRPGLTFWITQWGWPWMEETAMLMQHYPNVVTDTGMLYFDSAREFYRDCFARRIPITWIDRALRHQVMFASGHPRFEQARMVEALTHLPFRDSTLELLLGGNVETVLEGGRR